MTKEEQQARATLNDHIVIHKVTDNIFAMHKDGTAVYAVDVIRKPLVRCRDCKWFATDNLREDYCSLSKGLCWVDDGTFCSYGERRE